MNKRRTIGFVFMVSLLFTTGCWDRTELTDRALVMGYGFDLAPNGTYIGSIQFAEASELAAGQTGGGGQGQGKGFYVESAAGKTVLDSTQNAQTTLSREIFASHRRVIVIGERLARHGIAKIIDEYGRNPDVRLRTDIFVVKGDTAEHFLKMSYRVERVPATGVLKMYDQIGSLKETAFLNFLIAAASESSYPTLPAVKIIYDSVSPTGQEQEDPSVKGFGMVGTAIFDKDLKLIGFLNKDGARALRWINGDLKKQMLTAFVPQGKGYVSLDLSKMGSKIQPRIQGKQIKIVITLTGQGMIRENNTDLDLKQSKNIILVQNALDQEVKTSVLKTITKVQKKYRADVFNFGDAINRTYPYRWKSLKKNWDKEFPETEILVNAQVKVPRVGLTGSSLQLRESGTGQ